MISLPRVHPRDVRVRRAARGTMTLAALLVACGLPNFKAPILDRNLTNDRFALFIPEAGPEGSTDRALRFLKSTGPVEVRSIRA